MGSWLLVSHQVQNQTLYSFVGFAQRDKVQELDSARRQRRKRAWAPCAAQLRRVKYGRRRSLCQTRS